MLHIARTRHFLLREYFLKNHRATVESSITGLLFPAVKQQKMKAHSISISLCYLFLVEAMVVSGHVMSRKSAT